MKYIKPIPAPQKTFFFERPNGTWFAAEEYEAMLHLKRIHNTVKLVGTSDGKAFHDAMVKAAAEATEKVKVLDAKVSAGKMKDERYEREIEKINLWLLQVSTDERAKDYAASKGKIDMPRNLIAEREASKLNQSQQSGLSRLIG